MNFTNEEYKSRLKKVQAYMQKKGIELLISQDPSNMNYLTGYDAWSFYYAQCVIVHVNAEEPICFNVSQIKVWLLDKTTLPVFFSKSLIIDKTGSAVHETNKASLFDKSFFTRTSNK